MKITAGIVVANRYRLIHQLGSGAFSVVWCAEDLYTSNMAVALKIYAPSGGLDQEGLEIFSNEYRLLFDYNHPNLLKPMHFDIWEGSPYLVMPFCSKGSVLSKVGTFSEDELIAFIRDISAGLEYLHKQGCIHQDIKPDNILIDSNGRFVITDFGISTRVRKTLRRSLGKTDSAGTLAYMAPERFSKDPHPIMSSDIFSLGVTAYELASGDLPFGENGGLSLRAGAEIPDLGSKYSAELSNLIGKCLSIEPWDRPKAEELHSETSEYISTGKWSNRERDQNNWGNTKKTVSERHWFVTLYLWLAVLASPVSAAFNFFPKEAFGSDALETMPNWLYMLSGISNLMYCASAIMLLKRIKWGFWMMCICSGFLLISILVSGNATVIAVGSGLISILIVFGILNIKKKGVSYWAQLKGIQESDRKFLIWASIIVIFLSTVFIGVNIELYRYANEEQLPDQSIHNDSLFIEEEMFVGDSVVIEEESSLIGKVIPQQIKEQEKSSINSDNSRNSTILTYVASDKSCQLSLPRNAEYKRLSLNLNEVIGYGDGEIGPVWAVCRDGNAKTIILVKEQAEDDLNYLMGMAMEKLVDYTILSSKRIKEKRYEGYHIVYEAEESGIKYKFHLVKLRGKNGYYDLLGWTLKSRFNERSDEIYSAMMSFKEIE